MCGKCIRQHCYCQCHCEAQSAEAISGWLWDAEAAEILSINPLIPQSWGTSKAGGHPQSPARGNPSGLPFPLSWRGALATKQAQGWW